MMPAKTVQEYMTTDVVTLRETDSLRTAVELVLLRRMRHVPVLDTTDRLAGIVTDRDIKRVLPSPLGRQQTAAYETLLDDTSVERVMTREPIVVQPDTTVVKAVQAMLRQRIGGLPVVQGMALVGMFTQTDALRGYVELLQQSEGA